MATITITVTVAGGKFVLDGVSQATYSATPGNTYKFDQSDGTNATHPLRLSTTSDGTHNSGSAYTDGVTTNGTPGSAGAYTQIEVTATTVQALFYYCSSHSGMGGSFNTGDSGTVQYQDRKGFAVQNFSSDQTSVGQIYYDSSSGQFKTVNSGGAPIGSWASGGNLNQARDTMGSSTFGTNTASVYFGGFYAGPTLTAKTELYNGSAWTEVNDMNTARRYLNGAGISTAALAAGGTNPAPTNTAYVELWDGTNWTETTDLNTAKAYGAGWGATNTAAIAVAGQPVPSKTVEQWNGSAWTEVAEYNTARLGMGSFGTTYTSGVIAGGSTPSYTNIVEQWNGSAWTEINDLNQTRGQLSGSGLTTAGLVYGGYTTAGSATTEAFDGSSWTEVNDLATARWDLQGAGNSGTNALAAGGDTPGGKTNVTEEWTAADFQIKTVTTS